MPRKLSGLLISDFTLDVLKSFFSNQMDSSSYDVRISPFGQKINSFRHSPHIFGTEPLDFVVVWNQITAVIPSFQRILCFEEVSQQELLSECDQFISAIKEASTFSRYFFVVNWALPGYFRGYGPVDLRKSNGWQHALLTLNKHFAQELAHIPNVYLLSSERWLQIVGEKACDPRLWYMSKIPYDMGVFKLAAEDIKAALRACLGGSRKLVILDLDDTLWGGIVGDDGWQNLRLGGHDAQGEAYADFQRALKSYQKRGVLLAIVSKNQENIALEVFDRHPEVILKKSDFVGWRINWKDKTENITDLLKELNLTQEAAVYIDNSPIERARIQESLPGVLVPSWTQNSLLYTKAFLSLSCFDTAFVSDDDQKRSQMYLQEKDRSSLRAKAPSMDEWLSSLNTTITIEPLTTTNLPRATQLLNKTNQMNLTTRRLNEGEFLKWSQDPSHRVWIFRVEDKMGDSGLTGIASFACNGQEAKIIDFILSCRVFGRQIENAMMETLIREAKKLKIQKLTGVYLPTEKNIPCLEFLSERCGSTKISDHTFMWDTKKDYPRTRFITVKEVETFNL